MFTELSATRTVVGSLILWFFGCAFGLSFAFLFDAVYDKNSVLGYALILPSYGLWFLLLVSFVFLNRRQWRYTLGGSEWQQRAQVSYMLCLNPFTLVFPFFFVGPATAFGAMFLIGEIDTREAGFRATGFSLLMISTLGLCVSFLSVRAYDKRR